MSNLKKGLIEVSVGIVLVIFPEPATTSAGVTLIVDGVRRVVSD